MSAVETLRCQGRPSSLDPQKQSVHNLLPLSPEPNNPGTGEPDPHFVRLFRGALCGALLHSLLLLEARTFFYVVWGFLLNLFGKGFRV